MNPMQVAQNRTARLVREATTPTYTTVTPVREHMMVVELEHEWGGRIWSKPMPDSAVDAYLDSYEGSSYGVSDIDHAAKCWCFKGK